MIAVSLRGRGEGDGEGGEEGEGGGEGVGGAGRQRGLPNFRGYCPVGGHMSGHWDVVHFLPIGEERKMDKNSET